MKTNDHKAALARIDALMDAAAGTPEADELSVLADLVEAYEAKHFPIELPTPVEAIRFRMEQVGRLLPCVNFLSLLRKLKRLVPC